MLGRCTSDGCQHLTNLRRQFCTALELKLIKWQEVFQHLSSLRYEDVQAHLEELINLTVENPLNLTYPVKRSYQLVFLKQCIHQAEEHNIEFSKAYELYIQLLNEKNANDETNFKHYFAGDNVITLKESNSFISQGTTGLCTWQAGIALANWCLCFTQVISAKRVIELGCGSGLTGLVLLKTASCPKEYTFTDCHPLVLQQLRQNLEINIPGEQWPRTIENTCVDVCQFDWGDIDDENLKNIFEADVILGADIVYDIDLIELLCSALQKLLNTQDKCAIIACTIRNQETINSFIRTIERKSLTITTDRSPYPMLLHPGLTSPPVEIYIIKKN